MKHIYILEVTEMREAIAKQYNVSPDDVIIRAFPRGAKFHIEAQISSNEITEDKPQAYWEYWAGWCGNHDKRIDDATCSNCGFKHPTVRGYNAPEQLYEVCPKCGRHMGKKEA